MLNWLAHRLDLPYVHFTPSSDTLWGIAVFSRYPILTAEDHPLPPRDLPLKRSFTYLEIDIGQTAPLHLINAHFHHIKEDSTIRLAQTETVLNFLAKQELRQPVIITGDLNATPETPEIQRLYEWGFQDAVIDAKLIPGYTFESDHPYKRLDYVLISPDLTIVNAGILPSMASDHLAIVATLKNR
jgi:endonuclease/exonuclease/phosphatase family metal-dependent hydrolase